MNAPVGVAEHDQSRMRVGKVHRTKSGRTPTAKRNRARYRTACGRRVEWGLPVPTDTPGATLCTHCWPNA